MTQSTPQDSGQTGTFLWPRCFLRQAPNFDLDRRGTPYRRLSVTVLLAHEQPFLVRADDGDDVPVTGIIAGPAAPRSYLQAPGPTTTIDAFITSEAYSVLLQAIGNPVGRPLDANELAALRALAGPVIGQLQSLEQARALFDDMVAVLNPAPDPVTRDARVDQAMALVEEQDFEALSVAALADAVHVSVSRLNALFKRDLLCSPLEYIRSVCLWKALPVLAGGGTLTEAAHTAGFHDLAHFSKAVTAITGFAPSQLTADVVALDFY